MDTLLERLNADVMRHRVAMLFIAGLFGLPYVEEDLIEYMEFWQNQDTNTVSIILITDSTEVYQTSIGV